MSTIAAASKFSEQIMNTLRDMQREATSLSPDGADKGKGKDGGMSFAEHMQQSIKEVNGQSQKADRMATNLTTGKSDNIHETMLAATQAELSFNMLVQIRNKALEAYSEVMRMPV